MEKVEKVKKREPVIYKLKKEAEKSIKVEITGRNKLISDLFAFLISSTDINCNFLLLITKKGLILNSYSSEPEDALTGAAISENTLKSLGKDICINQEANEFTLVYEDSDLSNSVNLLQSRLQTLLAIVDSERSADKYLLDCLNVVDNSICIYDKEAALLYGNKSYMNMMGVTDRDSVTGMKVEDIARQSGLKFQATKNGSSSLKIRDVLKSGKKLLDWEVQIESQTSASNARLVSNNMYPIVNKDGSTDGIIEISSSHQVSLNKMKKLIGLTAEYTFDSIIGQSDAIKNAIQQAKDYAANPYSLLIVGESGVGKELFAQSVHNFGNRKFAPFVALNCANFPENLIESELFGYVGGAFTGAAKNGQIGKFELADGGTLFLDEIGELPLNFQAKLLRVLETGKFTRIGSSRETNVNVRIIAATNRDLEEMVEEGIFRKDLYYRLQVLRIEVPPLRERASDIISLAHFFFKQAEKNNELSSRRLDKNAEKILLEYSWPGNVRELKNAVTRAALLSKTGIVTEEVLKEAISSKNFMLRAEASSSSQEDESEKNINDKIRQCKSDISDSYIRLINTALDASGGNKKLAADLMGISRRTLYRMMERYGIS